MPDWEALAKGYGDKAVELQEDLDSLRKRHVDVVNERDDLRARGETRAVALHMKAQAVLYIVEMALIGWLAFVLCGCATTPHLAGSKQLKRSTWALAESREHWPDLSGDPETDLVNLGFQIRESGARIRTRKRKGRSWVDCHSGTIHMRRDWHQHGDAFAVRKLGHEFIHWEQMQAMGCAAFHAEWGEAGGRAWLDLQPRGFESFGYVLYQEGTPAQHEAWVLDRVTSMYDDRAIGGSGYVLKTIDRDHWVMYASETLRRAAR